MFFSLLGILALICLIAIALSSITVAAAVERIRLQRQAEMESHWQMPERPLRVMYGSDLAVPCSDYSAGLQLVPGEAPDWRKALPPKSGS
jgi:hypothetical protein